MPDMATARIEPAIQFTYIAGALLLAATAVSAQTAAPSDTKAIINAAKTNLDAMKRWEDARKTPITGISADCQAAISSKDVNPECVDDIETNAQDTDFAPRCAAPADGAKDHRCSTDQVNKALDTLDAKCKAELEAKNADIVSRYTAWQIYTVSESILCSKTSAGSYCLLDTAASTNATGNPCVTEQLKLVKDWKAPRPDKYTSDSAAALRTAAAALSKGSNSTTSPSNKTGSTGGKNASSKTSSYTTGAAALTAGALAVASLLM
ncbi:hypothetical protein SYNPS1DRAFT_22578 [Syncephalis pseudoplumigaleata]|uniref:Uncharacterized protein n=1 Tax=Syncephalis pseudoplumigaleata TaxID=1712513 RepID=A0A4P9YZB3_9FUNG|nr:hypothetical protein SYNPS1DRAFT_22578 [Syncephalis pseudoplumigaleata]|eukprot:RKP25466.1 hypothetical protein SYNPS1DRAFT_22578 [Syncephalis pseudoplumigaleata]